MFSSVCRDMNDARCHCRPLIQNAPGQNHAQPYTRHSTWWELTEHAKRLLQLIGTKYFKSNWGWNMNKHQRQSYFLFAEKFTTSQKKNRERERDKQLTARSLKHIGLNYRIQQGHTFCLHHVVVASFEPRGNIWAMAINGLVDWERRHKGMHKGASSFICTSDLTQSALASINKTAT